MAGFNATGIFPFNKERVLIKIPSRFDDANIDPNVTASWTEAFVDILSDVRNKKDIVKKARGKRIDISAGKSIRVEDIQKDKKTNDFDDPDDPNSIVLDEDITDIYAPSTSGTQKERGSLEKINEEECIDQNISLRKGDFIIVKYETNKRNLMYIGQVVKNNCPLIEVNFLRKKTSIDGSYFVFPNIKDVSNVTRLQVVRKLVPGKILKRGRFIFDTIDTDNFQ
jgi:hypothetical protein